MLIPPQVCRSLAAIALAAPKHYWGKRITDELNDAAIEQTFEAFRLCGVQVERLKQKAYIEDADGQCVPVAAFDSVLIAIQKHGDSVICRCWGRNRKVVFDHREFLTENFQEGKAAAGCIEKCIGYSAVHLLEDIGRPRGRWRLRFDPYWMIGAEAEGHGGCLELRCPIDGWSSLSDPLLPPLFDPINWRDPNWKDSLNG